MKHTHIFHLIILLLFAQLVTLSPTANLKVKNNRIKVDLNTQQLPANIHIDSLSSLLSRDKEAVELPENKITWPNLSIRTQNQTNNLPILPSWIVTGEQAEERFGYAVDNAGDVNGDGYSEIIVGAYLFDNGQVDEGQAYVFYGSINGLELSPSWTEEINQAGAWFGYSVSGAGDVNGDGYSDVIISAPMFDNEGVDEGRVYSYYGSATGLSSTPSWSVNGNQANEQFGFSVSSTGDVNGDGFSDVIVGSIYYSNGQAEEGGVFVFYGSENGLELIPSQIFESNQAGAWFGWPVNTAGDVNADGYSDVIVGAVKFDNKGRVFVFHGSAYGLVSSNPWTVGSNQIESRFGYSADSAGDVNGDGFSDVIISAVWYDNPEINEGQVYIYNGSANGLITTPSWIVDSNQAEANFGWSATSAGDIDDDGYSDVIIGSPDYDTGQPHEGQAFVYFGSATGPNTIPDWTTAGEQEGASLGWSANKAGDINGDGFSDVVIGANLYDNDQHNPPLPNAGRAYVFTGWHIPHEFDRLTPINNSMNVSTNPTLSWTDSRSADDYEYCIDTSNDDACALWISNGSSNSANLTGLERNTTYYWHVRANNEYGTIYAGNSEVDYWSFTTENLPSAFGKINPPNNSIEQPLNLTLEWGESIDASNYEYCYDTLNDDQCPLWISTGISTSVSLSGLEPFTTYYWQIRAINNFGITYADGSEDSFWNFTTESLPGAGEPGPFDKIIPANYAIDQPTDLILDWEDSSNTNNYKYCYDTSDNNSCDDWISAGITSSVSISGLQFDTIYYWQVRAYNYEGVTEANDGTWWNFTTIVEKPGDFTKISPLNGAGDVVVSPLLSWETSVRASYYEYCIDNSGNDTCDGNWTSITSTQVILNDLTYGTTYYWHVRAHNMGGTVDSNAGTWWSFTTILKQPDDFNKIAPVNGAFVLDQDQMLSWENSNGAISYEYCYDTTDDSICSGTWIANGMNTNIMLSGLVYGNTYYWQVRAFNLDGYTYADTGTMWSFSLMDISLLPLIIR